MREALLIIDVLAAFGIVGLVLLQQGKGADMGAAFGSGASQTLFGARGSANFLTRGTAILAIVFFLSNVGIAWLESKDTRTVPTSVTEQPVSPDAPAAPSAPSDTQPKAPEVPN